MLITSLLDVKDVDFLCREDYDDTPAHVELKERLRKTFYYGRNPTIDRPSLPMTELAVEFLRDAAPRQLGQVDMYWASSVTRRAAVSPCSMILGMMYIDRLKHKNPEYLQQISSSELFLISMMLASKYLYDEGVTEEVFNDEWAESAKMDTADINEMEREFLDAIDWSLYTHAEDFWRTLAGMERTIAARMGQQTGYFSYTDLHTLTGTESMCQTLLRVLQDILKVMMACSLAYVAGTMTMAASPIALTTAQSRLPAMSSLPFSLPEQGSKVTQGSGVMDSEVTEGSKVILGSEFLMGSELESRWMEGIAEENDTGLDPPTHPYFSPPAQDPTPLTPSLDPARTPHTPSPTLDPPPRVSVHLGLPGLITLAILKDTVIGFTTSLLNSPNSPVADSDPEVCPSCRCNRDDRNPDVDLCLTPARCYQCERSQTELSEPALSPDHRICLDHRKSRDPHASSYWPERCDGNSDLFSRSVGAERVRDPFSDINLGFQTATQVPLAA